MMESKQRFTFAQRDRPACEIIVRPVGDSGLQHAAGVLQGAIRSLSGAEVRLVGAEAERSDLPVVIMSLLPQDEITAQALQEQGILACSEADLLRVSTASSHIILSDDLGAQGFLLYHTEVDGRPSLIVAANTAQGCLYGAYTLADALHWQDGELVVDQLHTRHLPVANIPAFETRSVATNIGGPDWLGNNQWEKEWERDGEYDYRGFIDWLASHKINQLTMWPFDLAFGIAYRSERFPECVNPYHPNVRHEFIDKMIDYAHERHISVFFFVDFPDNWTAIIKAHPELAGKNVNVDELQHLDPARWETYQRAGRVGAERLRALSWVCASHPGVMAFWEAYWDELLERYPNVDGVGGQFEEHEAYRCNCESCATSFFELQAKYFGRMCEIAARKVPGCQFWTYRSWGARDIWRNREQLPGKLIWVDWGNGMPAFETGKSVPRGDWYLYHRSKEQWYEYGLKHAAEQCHRHGIKGLQIRGVQYAELDRMYQAFGDFAWNPYLSVEDYARKYVRKHLRRDEPALADAYALWIEARGLQELADYQRAYPEWQAEEGYAARAEALRAELGRRLDELEPSGLAAELRGALALA